MSGGSHSLIIPLTFPSISYLHPSSRGLLEVSCSTAEPSILTSWSLSDRFEDDDSLDDLPSNGAVLGCKDGTLFIFHSAINPAVEIRDATLLADDISYVVQSDEPSSLSATIKQPNRTSHSASSSVSGFNSPFHMTTHSRVVSGITTERVEAPKNHVDFEDEPNRLKDILKGKTPKDKTVTDSLLPNSEKGGLLEKYPDTLRRTSTQASVAKRSNDPKSLLSATNSPAFTPKSLSRPSSPLIQNPVSPLSLHTLSNSQALTLRCHVIPARSGPKRSVTGLQIISENSILVSLQENGDLSILHLKDGTCIATTGIEEPHLHPPEGMKDHERSHGVWIWKRLLTMDNGETTIILACATVDATTLSVQSVDASDDETQEKTQLVVLELSRSDEQQSRLEKVGEWYIDGPPEGVAMQRESDNTLTLVSISTSGHLLRQQLRLLPRVPVSSPDALASEPHHHHHHHLQIPHLFKSPKATVSTEHLHSRGVRASGRIGLDRETDIGKVMSSIQGLRPRMVDGKMSAVAWSDQELVAFEYHDKTMSLLFTLPISNIRDATWADDESYFLTFDDRCEHYILHASEDDVPGEVQSGPHIQPKLNNTTHLPPYDVLHFTATSEILVAQTDKADCRQITSYCPISDIPKEGSISPRTLWKTLRASEDTASSPAARLTGVLPIELGLIILGYSDGYIRKSALVNMAQKLSSPSFGGTSNLPLGGSVMGLHLIDDEWTKKKLIIGGADDGSIAIWDFDSLKLCARWIIFTTPLESVIQFGHETGSLRGCILCCSQDGTIAVVTVDGFQFLHVIPGSRALLLRVCLSGDNLLLVYSDGRARLWDVKTKEFWRSMGLDKVQELLVQGGWTERILEAGICLPDTILNTMGRSPALDVVSSLCMDATGIITEAANVAKSVATGTDPKKTTSLILDRLRFILSTILTPGLNEEIDRTCSETLCIPLSNVFVGFSSLRSTALYSGNQPQHPWCISPDVSAARALAIVATLRALGLFGEASDDCNTVIAFYSTSLVQIIGLSYQAPSLPFLARRWFDTSHDLRQSARLLFDARVCRLSDDEATNLIRCWQTYLPCLQPDAERESLRSALSLFICGYVATEKFSLLSAGILTDTSKSIAIYLHDENSQHRNLAIDLCSRGFQLWQHYVDAMEILRALFTLATNPGKEAISPQNIGPQARLAVLQIASTNTALFVTTLAIDIHHSHSVEHRKSVMQIFAILIRRRPLVLYPNLPRLMEAVVKSLDPNSTASREAVLDTATEILGQVVKTFPTVDFHMQSQRLAVGTSEGAIVMYDLKTATRLYVLENHKQRTAACSFSPDGRRLVTVSLEEGVVFVWKVGSSFTSLFTPGAPPRQGHAGSEPFKTIPFNVGEDAHMTIAETLEFVRFEWPADRSVKLKIRGSVLTFST